MAKNKEMDWVLALVLNHGYSDGCYKGCPCLCPKKRPADARRKR